jgi:hypothetical protein
MVVLRFLFICWIVDMFCSLVIDRELHRMNCGIRYQRMNMFMKRARRLNGKLLLLGLIRLNILFYWRCYFRRKSNDIHLTSASSGTFSSFTVQTPFPRPLHFSANGN